MNKVLLIGNLTRDPELSETASGVSVCRFGLAVNPYSAQEERQTDFYNVTAWRKLGETVARFTKKGHKIAVYGDIQLRQYDGNDGTRKMSVDVIANDVEFLTPKGTNEGEPFAEEVVAVKKQRPQLEALEDDNDLPF